MPSNLNNQPSGSETPWYKKPISLSNIDLAKFFRKLRLKRKKSGSLLSIKKNIKDIRSNPATDGEDGIGVENPEILDIDLIKDEIPVLFEKKKNLYTLGVFVLLALFLVFEIYFFLSYWEQQEIRKKATVLQAEVTILDKEIADYKKEAAPAIEFKNKINKFGSVFDNHIYWTNLFSYLERNTLVDVYYSGLSGDISGTYSLHSWVKDFRAISFQLKTVLADKHTLSAKISNEKVNGGDQSLGVMFDLGLNVRPSIFNE